MHVYTEVNRVVTSDQLFSRLGESRSLRPSRKESGCQSFNRSEG